MSLRLTLLIERGDGTRLKYGMEVEQQNPNSLVELLSLTAATASTLRDQVLAGEADALPWEPIDPADRTVVVE